MGGRDAACALVTQHGGMKKPVEASLTVCFDGLIWLRG